MTEVHTDTEHHTVVRPVTEYCADVSAVRSSPDSDPDPTKRVTVSPTAGQDVAHNVGALVIDTAHLDARTELDPETRVFATLLSLIGGGFSEGRMALAVTAALESSVSAQCALDVLDRYTGRTFGDGQWSVHRLGQGQRLYRLLSPIS